MVLDPDPIRYTLRPFRRVLQYLYDRMQGYVCKDQKDPAMVKICFCFCRKRNSGPCSSSGSVRRAQHGADPDRGTPRNRHNTGAFAAKFIFGAFSFCSGAPGGTLYPMCILGTYGGAAFAQAAISACGMDPSLWQDFAVLGMAGLFASIVRAPVTGIILVFEITGNINTLLPLAAVSLISYAVANTLGSTPFYTALLDRISEHGDAEKDAQKGEKVLKTYVIPTGSPAHGKLISELDWGKHCVIVSVERGDTPITPKGGTQLRAGDELVFMISQRRYAETCKKIENAINGKNGE